MMWKALIVGLVVLSGLALLLYPSVFSGGGKLSLASSLACGDCNVILVSFDTLRADHLGVYGYPRNTSPTIDRFAEKAVVFEDCIVQAPWTLPSHMSILTSLYSRRHGVINRTFKLGDSTPTLVDTLRENGYRTAAFTGGGLVGKEYNYHGFDVFDDSGGWTGAKNFDKMLGWVRNNSGERFFLFWHDYQVHDAYDPPEKYDVFSDKDYSGAVNPYFNRNEPACEGVKIERYKDSCMRKGWFYYQLILENMTAEDVDYVKAKYDGEILIIDERFSKLLKLLAEEGILDKTIVVVTSDHGESFAERGHLKQIGHPNMYEEVLRVPLIVWAPGLERQVRFNGTVESVDIMPVVLGLLGVSTPENIDGRNLFAVNGSVGEDRVAYSENFNSVAGEYAVKRDRLKMIYRDKGDAFEFYDLGKDPLEHSSIFGLNTTEEGVLKGMLLSRIHGNISGAEDAVISNETLEQLKALGYVV